MSACGRILLCAAPVVFILGCPVPVQPQCTGDADCAAGQVCTNGQCVDEAGCTVDGDCAAGQVCTNGQCVDEAGCTVDGDCAAGQVCTNGECVAGGGTGGDPAIGDAFYTANGCAACHGADATGGVGPDIRTASAADIFARLSGAETHATTVADVTEQNAQDLEAWLGSLAVPPGFENADAGRGGALYDKWWDVLGVDAPTTDHPFWAARPDQASNTRTGADTWRCKECHGWDYKGVDGAYGGGSHRTGIAGIFGTTLSAQEVFDQINTAHGFGDAGFADEDVWDLAKFVLEAQIDTDEIIDASGAFIGSADDSGRSTYDTTCAACHGADGTQLLFDGGTVTLGGLAVDNPWEVQHKIRFGQPGTPAMPRQLDVLTVPQVGDLGAYAQSLPPTP